MGDIHGFQKYKRLQPKVESPKTRIQHFEEFYKETPEELKEEQAARCMDCGIPFCHNGCPLGNLIPDFNHAIFEKNWHEAYEILTKTNNFPEFTGRICPAPCESACVLGINELPVTIEFNEQFIIEKAYENGWVKTNVPSTRNGKKIAIIGSGPAGLACAADLNQKGYEVTVYEKNNKPGGLLRYGIPDFKLEKSIIDRRLDILEKEGVMFQTNTNIGVDIKVKELQEKYDSIVLCGGSEHPRDLPIKGRSLKGVHYAMEYLKQCNEKADGITITDDQNIIVKDADVVVIGGGDTGSDCIGNSNRLGARSITQLEIMGKPSETREDKNPWPLWPFTLKNTTSHKEGCVREWTVMTKAFLSDDGIQLSGIKVVNVSWELDDSGRSSLKEIQGSERILPCQKVFLAMGFVHPTKVGLLEELNLKLTDRGNVATNNYHTSAKHVFAAGDMRRGQSLVVWAINEGKECAIAVDQSMQEE